MICGPVTIERRLLREPPSKSNCENNHQRYKKYSLPYIPSCLDRKENNVKNFFKERWHKGSDKEGKILQLLTVFFLSLKPTLCMYTIREHHECTTNHHKNNDLILHSHRLEIVEKNLTDRQS